MILIFTILIRSDSTQILFYSKQKAQIKIKVQSLVSPANKNKADVTKTQIFTVLALKFYNLNFDHNANKCSLIYISSLLV